MSPPELTVVTDGLTKHFGDLVAVDHIDLQIESGTVFSDTPHAPAISATRTASKPRSRNIVVAVSEMSWRVRRFFRSRRPSPGTAAITAWPAWAQSGNGPC